MKMRYIPSIGRFLSLITILALVTSLLGACGKRSTKTEDPSLSETLIEDTVEIPEDGIITADQFNAFAGTDRTIEFIGTSGDIIYTWAYNGRNIHNATDMDLSIDFVTGDSLEDIREAANQAPYALGMTLKGTGTITVPTLTVWLPETWDADTAVLCKLQNGTLYRMSDVDISVDEENGTAGSTALSMKITEVGDTYYIVAGSSTAQAAESSESLEDASDSADEEVLADSGENLTESQGSSKNGSGTQDGKSSNSASPTVAPAAPTTAVQTTAAAKENAETLTCTISITCSTLLDNMDDLDPDKAEFVPSDGWILMPTEVTFAKGDSVLDVLTAVCKAYKISCEHNGSYVEGINQLYEYDCGELSGWMYSVDGWFPNYGADEYILSDGETIRWSYTCDLGKDVGDNSQW